MSSVEQRGALDLDINESAAKAAALAIRLLTKGLYSRTDVQGLDKLPSPDLDQPVGIVYAGNHLSKTMSIPLAHALADYALSLPADECQKRLPRFLAKLELFDAPILGRLLSSLQQIPVNRLAGKTALQTAEQALAAGHSVVVYPEATTTKDPDLWPCPITPEQDARFDGRYRHGAVKMAAKTGSLIIPTMQWLDRTNRLRRPTAHIHFGEPIRLSADANPADETRSLMLTVAKMMAEARSLDKIPDDVTARIMTD